MLGVSHSRPRKGAVEAASAPLVLRAAIDASTGQSAALGCRPSTPRDHSRKALAEGRDSRSESPSVERYREQSLLY